MKIIFAFLIAFAMSSDATSMGEGKLAGLAKIYYVPIGAETYVPVNEDNIEDGYVRSTKTDISGREFAALMALIHTAKAGPFKNDNVRVKIVFPDASVIYIDNNGGIKRSSTQRMLNSVSLGKLKDVLERITILRKK